MLSTLAAQVAGLVRTNWVTEVTERGEAVALWREYERGEHRAEMTTEMRQMLRIADSRAGRQFNANYCDMVIQSMADRLTVIGIEGDNDAATAWSAALLADNRFDGLQMDAIAASLRDGITFVMVGWDNDAQRVTLTHELAWDGTTGVIPIYDRANRTLIAAFKIWYEGENDARRVNLYYPDRIEKYVMGVGGGMSAMEDSLPWTDTAGAPLGVPLIALANRARTASPLGTSEIDMVVPLQDALNRTLVSMVITGELTGFPVRYAIGFVPPAGLAPGSWVTVAGGTAISNEQRVELGVMEQGSLVPFIAQAEFLIDQIGEVSRTPLSRNGASSAASGESLKQREVKLVSKSYQYQVKAGNAFEDMIEMAGRVGAAFGSTIPPVSGRWSCKWAAAELRNDAETVANVIATREIMGDEQALRQLARVFGWDAPEVARILAAQQTARTSMLSAVLDRTPRFGAL